MSDDKPNLNEVIARASLIKLEEVSKPVLDNIRDIWLKAKTRSGFTPTPEEAERLKRISQNITYRSFKSCIGSTPYLRFIKVGLMLYELMTEGNLDRIKEIKDEIYNSKYNTTALKIIHIASTGVLLNALEYLINLRDERQLSKYAVSLEFEKILGLWNSIAIPVQKDDDEKKIIELIKSKVMENSPLIVLYASQSAIRVAHSVIVEVNKQNLCQNRYFPWSKNLIYKSLEQYICIFYKTDGEWETPFG